MRSKRNVVVVIVLTMLALFTVGVLWRVFRPSPVERALRELPTYPGAKQIETGSAGAWTRYVRGDNPEGEARVLIYRLPGGTTSAAVTRYYREHLPDWRAVKDRCFARGDVRIELFLPQPIPGRVDVLVAERVRCV